MPVSINWRLIAAAGLVGIAAGTILFQIANRLDVPMSCGAGDLVVYRDSDGLWQCRTPPD